MKVTYTGRQTEFPSHEMDKIAAQIGKLSKILDDTRGEREAHVVLKHERHLHHAEVTVNYHNHALVGLASATDAFTAVHEALDKLDKQAHKEKAKWRDTHRDPKLVPEKNVEG